MSASWVIREIDTGKVVMETFVKKVVDSLNTLKYEAVPIKEYLASLNAPYYVVKNEHTLGYMITHRWMNVLHGSVLKGGHDWKNGAVCILPGHDEVRAATEKDFEEYRVVLPRDFKEKQSRIGYN